MGVEVRAGARSLGQVPMAGQGVGRDVKRLDCPCERECGPLQLGFRHDFLVEVSLAEDQEVSCRVVVRCGIAGDLRRAQFVDVAVAVDADVIRDIDPSLLVLVVALVLAKAAWGVAVVAENDGLVVEGHAGDGVVPPTGARRSGTPGVSA